MTGATPYNPRAFSVLGYASADADVTRDHPVFAAYAPSREDAEGDRDRYRATLATVPLWVIFDHATGDRIFTLTGALP